MHEASSYRSTEAEADNEPPPQPAVQGLLSLEERSARLAQRAASPLPERGVPRDFALPGPQGGVVQLPRCSDGCATA